MATAYRRFMWMHPSCNCRLPRYPSSMILTESRRMVRIPNLHSALGTKLAAIVRRHSSREQKMRAHKHHSNNLFDHSQCHRKHNNVKIIKRRMKYAEKKGVMSTTNQTQLILFIQTKLHAMRNETFFPRFFFRSSQRMSFNETGWKKADARVE